MHGRRRRRSAVWLTVAVLMMVVGTAAVGAGVVGLLRGGLREPPAAAVGPTTTPARLPLQQTLDLDPTSGYAAAARISDAGRQTLTIRTLSRVRP